MTAAHRLQEAISSAKVYEGGHLGITSPFLFSAAELSALLEAARDAALEEAEVAVRALGAAAAWATAANVVKSMKKHKKRDSVVSTHRRA